MLREFSFPKKNRLVGEKSIRLVFKKGISTKSFPFLFYSMPFSFKDGASIKVAFGVSKKKIRHAFLRNKIKRCIKEAFRLNKSLFVGKLKVSYAVIIVYLAEGLEPQEVLSKKINGFFVRLVNSSNEVN